MELKPGSRWKSAVCTTEVAIVRPPNKTVILQCGGHPMIAYSDDNPSGLVISESYSSGSLMGKRYTDEDIGIEILCTKAGDGAISIDGSIIGIKETKKLPSSD